MDCALRELAGVWPLSPFSDVRLIPTRLFALMAVGKVDSS